MTLGRSLKMCRSFAAVRNARSIGSWLPLLRTPPLRRSHFGLAIDPVASLGSSGTEAAFARLTQWVTRTIFRSVTHSIIPCLFSARASGLLAPHSFWGASFPSTVHAQAKRIRKMRSAMQKGFHMPGSPAVNQWNKTTLQNDSFKRMP